MKERIAVIEKIMGANERLAKSNRALLDEARVMSLNFMASPGAGKTSLIEQTLARIGRQIRIAVVDGDVATSIDADRAAAAGAIAVQINTGGGCHLDAVMVQEALFQLDLSIIDLLIVENVGNLICPANFQLGTHQSVLIASVTEGDDKPYKYPGMYQGADILVINKIDLLPYIDFDLEYFKRGVEALNPGLLTFSLSCRTGEGLDDWKDWLSEQLGLEHQPPSDLLSTKGE
jgi:hydrogenase nickel incorporation protein HypB